MKLQWVSDYDMIGNSLGYSTHQRRLKEALEQEGVEITDDADIAVSITTPDRFFPVPDKYNVLYTMYECTTIPDEWVEPLDRADLIVVPCEHNKRLFRMYTDTPVVVCWEGVQVDRFTYVERKFPANNDPFMFLWIGASNPRKGYEHVVFSWKLFREKHPDWNVVLYLKTTQVTREERLLSFGDTIIDTRLLPLEKEAGDKRPTLVELYHAAHAFLLPSMGEGFGLTLAEAMSTGLPCIYTPWSGPVDFCSFREGYPVKWKFVTVKTREITQQGIPGKVKNESKAASAIPESIVEQMERIYLAYDTALIKGKRAAERIRRDITWQKSAKSFMKIIEEYKDKKWTQKSA